eukprot:gene11924-13159_t
MGEPSSAVDMELDETSLQELYTWIDEIPLSRPKKNISRDFSDGVLVAEIVNHFLPKMVDLHNYAAANGNQAKMDNWNLLTRKVLSKMNFHVQQSLVKGIITSRPGVIEVFLHQLRQKIDNFQAKKKAAALREKNHIYDELEGDISSRSDDYYPDNYQYMDGPSFRLPQGNTYPPGYNYGNYPNNQQAFQGGNPAGPQGAYYYHSEPRMAPENRQHPAYPSESSKVARHLTETSPHSDQHGKTKQNDRSQKTQPYQDSDDVAALRMALEEKEQALLSSQETVQILNVKVRRLEHLLHLKNLRIDDLNNKLNTPQLINSPPNQLSPPSQNYPPASLPPVPPLKQHPPLPGIYPKAGAAAIKHHS